MLSFFTVIYVPETETPESGAKDLKLTQPLEPSLNDIVGPLLVDGLSVKLYSPLTTSNVPRSLFFPFKFSLNQLFIPTLDIGVNPSIDNLKAAPLCVSVKYNLY